MDKHLVRTWLPSGFFFGQCFQELRFTFLLLLPYLRVTNQAGKMLTKFAVSF